MSAPSPILFRLRSSAAGERRIGRLARLPWALLPAGVSVAAWLLVAPRTPDYAAQFYRQWLFAHFGFALWDNYWYAGHALPAYSLSFPAVADLLGLRAAGAAAVICSALLFTACVRKLLGRPAPAAEMWFALAASCDIWIGRLTFALGVSLALAAWLAHLRARAASRRGARAYRSSAALLAVCAAASSPVAGLLMALAAFSLACACSHDDARTPRALAGRLLGDAELILPPPLVAVALQALFREGGFEPFPAGSLVAAAVVTLAFLAALPPDCGRLKIAGWLYLPCLALATVHSPMGSNVERYAVLLAAPALLAALAGRPGGAWREGALAGRIAGGRAALALRLLVLIGIGFWTLWGPINQSMEAVGEASTESAFYAPLKRYFADHVPRPVRIEVPPSALRWEAALVAPDVALARGWERQLDKRYGSAIESRTLSAGAYRAWLERYGVSYVALPQERFGSAGAGEVRLIRSGPPYLQEVARTGAWRIYAVRAAASLMSAARGSGAAGELLEVGHDSFSLRAAAAGSFLIKLHYCPYWTVRRGRASVRAAADGFTEVRVAAPGRVDVEASFSASGAARALAEAL